MATLRELFEGEFGHTLRNKAGVSFTIGTTAFEAEEQIYLSFDEYSYFLGYFVEEQYAATDFLHELLMQSDDSRTRLNGAIAVFAGHPGIYEAAGVSNVSLLFTGRIIMYVDAALETSVKESLVALGISQGRQVQIRGRRYAEEISKFERPLGFISHDSRDKDDFVRPLADRLRTALCPVWYDEFSMKPGASLRESIDAGLRDSKRCVVVLSPNFLDKPGWGKAEFNAIMNKHFAAGGNVLIPIWHGVTRKQVADYSSMVVDIFGIDSNRGLDEVFDQVHRAPGGLVTGPVIGSEVPVQVDTCH